MGLENFAIRYASVVLPDGSRATGRGMQFHRRVPGESIAEVAQLLLRVQRLYILVQVAQRLQLAPHFAKLRGQ
jgi:hypothetical protein